MRPHETIFDEKRLFQQGPVMYFSIFEVNANVFFFFSNVSSSDQSWKWVLIGHKNGSSNKNYGQTISNYSIRPRYNPKTLEPPDFVSLAHVVNEHCQLINGFRTPYLRQRFIMRMDVFKSNAVRFQSLSRM